MTPLFLLAAAGCLLYLGWSDLRARLLPNRWVLLYALLFFPVQALMAPGWGVFGGHLLVGALAFVVLALLFALNAMGGGDVKLGAAVFLWAGPQAALTALIITAWLGGLLGIIGWLLDRAALRPLAFAPLAALRHALSAQRGVPYGVGLAVSGLVVLLSYL